MQQVLIEPPVKSCHVLAMCAHLHHTSMSNSIHLLSLRPLTDCHGSLKSTYKGRWPQSVTGALSAHRLRVPNLLSLHGGMGWLNADLHQQSMCIMIPFEYLRSPPDLWRTAVVTLAEELEHRKDSWSGWRTEAANLGSPISVHTLACGGGVGNMSGCYKPHPRQHAAPRT